MEAVGGTVREKQRDNERKEPGKRKAASGGCRMPLFLIHMLTFDNSIKVPRFRSLKFLRAKTGSLARVLQVKRVKS